MKRFYLLIFFSFTCIASYGQSDPSLTDASQDFAFKLFNRVLADREVCENVNVSPLSAQLALSMLVNGAKGDTKDEILKALSFGGYSLDEVNAFSNSLLDDVTKRPEFNYVPFEWMDEETALNAYETAYPQCELANGIWMRYDIVFQDKFAKTMKEIYYAGIDHCDFTTNEGVGKVNGWVNEHTHGLIEKVFNEPQGENLAIVLANALYFKGAWSVVFDEALTHDAPFYLPDGKGVNVKMMNVREYFKSFNTANFKTVTLNYGQSGKFSMTIFLPIDDTSMPDLSLADWKATFSNGQNAYKSLNLYMPQFAFDDGNNLVNTLKNLGMLKAFESDADLTNMVAENGYNVDKVFQLSKIKVNEKGTEAAAVTIIEIESTNWDEPEYEDFVVNHPFYFTIEDRETGTLLFIGRVSDFMGDKFEVATSISKFSPQKSVDACYDISGKIVNPQTYKGIYITNGKKAVNR